MASETIFVIINFVVIAFSAGMVVGLWVAWRKEQQRIHKEMETEDE